MHMASNADFFAVRNASQYAGVPDIASRRVLQRKEWVKNVCLLTQRRKRLLVTEPSCWDTDIRSAYNRSKPPI